MLTSLSKANLFALLLAVSAFNHLIPIPLDQ
jgi:hypothetical protein